MMGRVLGSGDESSSLSSELQLLLDSSLQLSHPSEIPNESLRLRSERSSAWDNTQIELNTEPLHVSTFHSLPKKPNCQQDMIDDHLCFLFTNFSIQTNLIKLENSQSKLQNRNFSFHIFNSIPDHFNPAVCAFHSRQFLSGQY